MDTSSFSNFYQNNQSAVDKIGLDLASNLLGSFVKKKEDKPTPYVQPAPQIVQVSGSSGKKDYTMYMIVGAVVVVAIGAFVALRK